MSHKQHEEYQYLQLIEKCLAADVRDNRTNTPTRSIFGEMMRFDLSESFPLLTTKRVYWKGVVEELLWFIRGDTSSKRLSEKGVTIWNANGSREFLDSRGIDREEGDLGPIYGWQWRHFGAKYVDCETDYTGQGYDQLADCINKIKKTPCDRRIIMSAWNPTDLNQMALPPCHMFCQFFVDKGRLSSLMYQRSADMGLGVPFNIVSYSLLTCMVAKVCGLERGEFIHTLGDVHVYTNHEEALKTQLERQPRPFPKLIVKDKDDIDSFTIDDFELVGYDPHPSIKMDMVA